MSVAIDSKLGQAKLSRDSTNVIILAFGSSSSGKSELLERIRLTAQPISHKMSVSDEDFEGIKEVHLRHDGTTYRILDAGDAGPMQALALSQVTDLTAIMFVANLAGYDHPLPSDPSRTLLEADIELFDTVINSPQFKTTPIMLYFNNSDELKRKLDSVPLWKVFPDYMEPGFESDAMCYLCAKFWALGERRDIYAHVTSRENRADLAFLKDILGQQNSRVQG